MATQTIVDDNGVREIDVPDGQSVLPPELQQKEEAAAVEVSAATARLAKLKSQSGASVEMLKIGGEKWFIRRLNWAALTRLAILSSRSGDGQINPTESDDLTGLAAATLQSCVCTDEKGDFDFFTLAEAHEWVKEPGAKSVVDSLFNQALKLNPEILPRADGSKKS